MNITTIEVTSILKDFFQKNIFIKISKITRKDDDVINITLFLVKSFDSSDFDEQILLINQLGETEYFNQIISNL